MWSARNLACGLYLVGTAAFSVGLHIDTPPAPRPISPLERATARGLVRGWQRLDADDPMANAAILKELLDSVPYPGGEDEVGRPCTAAPRSFAVMLGGSVSWVHFASRAVCQLQVLKRVAVAQPGFAEVGAFIVGHRLSSRDVDVTRLVVPPFRFSRDMLWFQPADLGALVPGERMLGTYHTHPDGDLAEGSLSRVDLYFMRHGYIDFHGQVGPLWHPDHGLEWLFDIVDTADGGWNVFAHDADRLDDLLDECLTTTSCPVNQLRTAGSRYYLLTRWYDERASDFWMPN